MYSSRSVANWAAERRVSYIVAAIEEGQWMVESESRESGTPMVPVPFSKPQVQTIMVWRDADGNVLDTQEEVSYAFPIFVDSIGPVLTLDWDCHRQAWLQRREVGGFPGGRAEWFSRGTDGQRYVLS